MQNSFLDYTMPIITNLGTTELIFGMCIIILIYGILKNKKEIKYLAIIALISLALTDTIISIIKVIVNEPRPFISLDSVHLLVTENDPYSFPSGHTGNIFSFAIALGINWTLKIKNYPIKLAWILIPIACIVAFSRIYVGVHYPLDVIVGMIIGIIGGVIATKIEQNHLYFMK
jgi:undecaprenyl-diphosphatase